jgi:hypothetical protein
MATDQMRGVGTADAGSEADGLVSQAQQQVQEKAQDVKGQASQKAREQIDARSTEIGGHVGSLGKALRRAAEQLDGEGKGAPAAVARQAAGQVERLGGYLENSSSDRFLGDVESFARRRPWVACGVGALLGLAASRFLKASSGQRYASSQRARADLDAPVRRDSDGSETSPTRAALPAPERREP